MSKKSDEANGVFCLVCIGIAIGVFLYTTFPVLFFILLTITIIIVILYFFTSSQPEIKKYTSSELNSMNGYEFEEFLKQLFKNMGYSVKSTKKSGDQGADLILKRNGKKIVVQAKRYNVSVGNRAVQEVAGAIPHYGAHKGIVVTNSKFTKSAVELAKSNNIKLVDGKKLDRLIKDHLN